ncbi:WAT1-related protein At5g64700 isoform X1 [Elaeis guineensis]|uniref:WAT1-related protein n=1 Tax=Elaeis guineensis var. tenera TaxID=51953 RepID=A0A6J0PDY5_ELAGV|nr:WAT1-related protein At5g64700 isoform X1 [Elaeis guineensis]
MNNAKVHLAVFLVRAIYAGLHITSKAAFNGGMSAYVFVLYRLVLATLFLAPFAFVLERRTAPPLPFKLCFKIFLLSLFGVTATLIIYSVALDYTSATLSSAIMNSIPVVTFIVAVTLGQETVKLKRLSGIMKVSGVLLCLAGIMEMAFFKGPHIKTLNHHHLLGHGSRETNHPHTHSSRTWVLGTFLMTISNSAWSLWMVLQAPLLKEYPSKLTFTTLQCLFSTFQSFFIALAFERDFSRWKLGLDVGLVSVIYCGIIVTGVAVYLQSWVIDKRGPVFLAMSTPLTLIITIVCSYFLLGELVNLGSVLGGLLMVGGLYSVLWGQRKEQIDKSTPTEVDRKTPLDVKENGATTQV